MANLESLGLRENSLTGSIPPEIGNLARTWTWSVSLAPTTFPVSIPPEIGNLTNLTWLELNDNQLSGPIPQSLLQLDELRHFTIRSAQLCVPGTPGFADWLEAIESTDAWEAQSCNAADVAVLKALFEASSGTGWTESDGWLVGATVGEWHGVTADSLGRVTQLDLANNGLTGRVPANLGTLGRMKVLRIDDNALSGRLPLSMVTTPLRELRYANTGLCVPAEASFRAWLNTIASHEGTGDECAPLSDRDVLQALYEAMDGPNWRNNDGWLTDAALGEWYGVQVDNRDRVRELSLNRNSLSGPIPPEIGNLVGLTALNLSTNLLSGAIPPEIGNLASLTTLNLANTRLSGPIPPEIGNLVGLTTLNLANTRLSGPIPPEIGNLVGLTTLNLYNSRLSGPIPPEIGNLASLTTPESLQQSALRRDPARNRKARQPHGAITPPKQSDRRDPARNRRHPQPDAAAA